MQDHEWAKVIETFRGLWPKATDEMTPEQIAVWRSTIDRFNADQVADALRAHYAQCGFSPRINEIIALCREDPSGRVEPVKAPSLHDVYRRDLGMPDASDEEIERVVLRLLPDDRARTLYQRDFERARPASLRLAGGDPGQCA